VKAPARLLLLSLLLVPASAAAQPVNRTLSDEKDPDVAAFQTAQSPTGAFLQTLNASCDGGAVAIQTSGTVASRLRFDADRLEILDDTKGTPSVAIQIAETEYSGVLVGATGKCLLETKTRVNGAKAEARLDCRLGKGGAALEPPPGPDDAAAAAAACKASPRVSIDKDLGRIRISLRGTYQ